MPKSTLPANLLTSDQSFQHNPVVVRDDTVTDPRGGNASRIEELTTRVEEPEAALTTAHRRSDAWLSTVSHDLRGPLTLIIGHADQLLHRSRASRESSRRVVELESIVVAARRLDKMLIQIVESARLEEGRLAIRSAPIDLAPVIRDVVGASRRAYPTYPLSVEVPDSLPLVDCDASHVATIVRSLLSNAAVFSPEDSPIGLRAGCRDGIVSVWVADSGLGLSYDEREHVFEPRFRPERALHLRREGLGVSLWIARELALLSGGDLRVESPGPDRESTVSLELPSIALDRH